MGDTKRMNDDPALRSPEIEKLKLSMMDQDDPRVKEAQDALDAGPGSSPGNKGVFATGKSDYDPTGLRAAMSTNHAATHAELENICQHTCPRTNGQREKMKLLLGMKKG